MVVIAALVFVVIGANVPVPGVYPVGPNSKFHAVSRQPIFQLKLAPVGVCEPDTKARADGAGQGNGGSIVIR